MQQNGAEILWEDYTNYDYPVEETIERNYYSILDRCREAMKYFEATYTWEYPEERENAEIIVNGIVQKLKERGLTFELNKKDSFFLITIFLFEKTEEQYQTIENIWNEYRKRSSKSSVNKEIFLSLLVSSPFLILGFKYENWILAIIGVFVLSIMSALFHDKHDFNYYYHKVESYKREQKKVFCNENTNIQKMKELETKYEEKRFFKEADNYILIKQKGTEILWNEVEAFWNNYANIQPPEEIIGKSYYSIMDDCKEAMRYFDATCTWIYNSEEENAEMIVNGVAEKLKEKGFMLECYEENSFFHITVYLLEKTEEQYKYIREMWEECSNHLGGFSTGERVFIGVLTSLPFFILGCKYGNWILIILGFVFFILPPISLHEKYDYGYFHQKIEDYREEQKKVFCNENTDIQRIKELENKYPKKYPFEYEGDDIF